MAKSHPNQQNFSKGELSPLTSGNTEAEYYQQGLKTCLNMYSNTLGPVTTREGFKNALDMGPQAAVRVEIFNRGGEDAFTFVFLDEAFAFIRDIDNPIAQYFSSPWTFAQIDEVYIVPLPDGRTFYMLHPEVQPYKLVDSVGAINSQEFLTDGSFTVPASVTSLSVCVAGGGGGGGGSGSGSSAVTSGGGGGGSGVVKDPSLSVTPAEVIPIIIGAAGASGAFGADGADGGTTTVTATSKTVTAAGGLGGKKGLDGVSGAFTLGGAGGLGSNGGGDGGKGQSREGETANPDASDGAPCSAICGGSSFAGGIKGASGGAFSVPGLGGGGGGAGGYGDGGIGGQPGSTVASNSGAGGGGGRALVSTGGFSGGSGRVAVTWVTPGGGITLAPVVFTDAPAEWTTDNYPSCGAYYQSRLWLAATPDQGENFWASKVGEPEVFTTTATPTDDESLSYVMEKYGRIEWLFGSKNMLIGTQTGEWVVRGGSSTAAELITPATIYVIPQSSYGSASVKPSQVGDQIIYISPDQFKVRAINYQERDNTWMSVDLTLLSGHITSAKIKDLAWAQHPNNLLWLLLEDGTLCAMTYERSTNTIGWHRHETQGKVLSISSAYNRGRSVTVAAVERVNTEIAIEVLSFDYAMDAWSEVYVVTEITPDELYHIDGLDRLNGATVSLILDGAVHPDRAVGAASPDGSQGGFSGRVYLDSSASVVGVGLNFISEMETLDVDGGAVTGSGAGLTKGRNKIYIKVKDSAKPLINGQRGNDRSASTTMDSPEAPVTGIIAGDINRGWDRTANVNIKQDLPLPLTVLAVFGEITKNSF